jgi:hypothetical protein
MTVRDRQLNRLVDVADAQCPLRPCYWPRLDPGRFTQGVGYRGGGKHWLCGNREIHGCPHPMPDPKTTPQ